MEALEEIHTLRVSEMLANQNGKKNLVKDVKKMFPGANLILKETTWHLDQSQKLWSIDYQETFKQKPSGLPSAAALRKRIRSYGSADGDTKAAKAHRDVIVYWRTLLTGLKRGCK